VSQRIERRKAGTRRRAKLLKFAQRKAERQEARRKKMEKEKGKTGLEGGDDDDGDQDDDDDDDDAGGDVKRGEGKGIKGEGDDDDDDDDDWGKGEGEKVDVSGSDDDGESMFSSSLDETGSAGGKSKRERKEGGPSSRAEPYQLPADPFASVKWWRHPQHEKLRMRRLGITSREYLPREEPETVVQAYRYGHR
jgi:hypothetical protein